MPKIDTKKLEAYAQMIYERENAFNTYTLKTIAKRIKATGQLSAHDQQALKNIADISGDMEKITKELARITKMNIEDIEKIYAQVVDDGVNTYKPLYDFKGMEFKPITKNDHAIKLVRHWAELTAERIVNLSHTKAIGFTDRHGNFTDIQGAFQKTIDDAVIAVANGTIDFNSAMKGTIEQLGGSGVVVNYGGGVTRSIEAMVKQNLLWGAKEAAQSYDDYVSEDLGLDGFEVDAHSGCRPLHEFMQGKMYAYNGPKKVNGVVYEDGADALSALEDYNCLHFKTGVILGVSEPTYSQEELERIHNETTKKIEYNGRKKTLYEWKQTQRRLEREYRKAQTQSDMFKESGNNIATKDYRDRAKAIKSTYEDLTNSVPGLYDHSERMRTYFGNKNNIKAASSAIRNTHTRLKFNPDVDFTVKLEGYSSKVNEGISKASRKVAELGGKNSIEYLSLINLETGDEEFFEDGDEISVGSRKFWDFLVKNPKKKFAFIHNHNTDGYFSETDMSTLLHNDNIKVFGAIRIDGVQYFTEKTIILKSSAFFDKLFENELKDLNNKARNGIITAAERTKLREEIIVDTIIEKYTKGLIEIDGR